MHHLVIRCLGALEVAVGARTLSCGGPLQRGLLAVLLINANQVVSAARIVDMLWEQPPDTALGQVQTRIWRLRRLFREAVGPDTGAGPELVTRGGGYGLMIDPDSIDLGQFDRRVTRATALAADDRPYEAVAELRAALRLWRGPAFADVPAPGVRIEAAAVEERRLTAVERRVELELRLGLDAQLVVELMELVAAHPYRERLRGHLMLALHRCGRRAEAVQVYLEGYRTMVDRLGLEPGRELRDLHRSILLCDDGEPVAGPDPVVPTPATTPRELPRDPICLVGREDEATRLYRYLQSAGDASPVAVLSGVAGVGKSALAIRIAHLLAEQFSDGQLFAWLGGDPDPGPVLYRFLRMLGVPQAEIPEGTVERAALYRTCLADRRCVVVLDDVQSEAQVRPLLAAGRTGATLITSRRRLTALESVHQVEVEPLGEADLVTVLARIIGPARVGAEPEAADRIARRCLGLPLALRAVGARVCARPHWSLSRFADLLDDDDRRLTAVSFGDLDLRAALDREYRRLAPATRRLFRLLGLLDRPVFTSRDAARLAALSPTEAEDLVEELVEARLVRPGGGGSGERTAAGPAYHIDDLTWLFAREQGIVAGADDLVGDWR